MKHSGNRTPRKVRLLSLILALLLAISLAPSAFAAGTDASGPSFSSAEDAAAYMREKMKDRVSPVQFVITDTRDPADGALFGEIFDLAVAHTGKPGEGDNLERQIGRHGYSISYSMSGGVYTISVTYNVTYYTTAEQEQTLAEEIDRVIDSLGIDGKTDYEKFDAIYDYIVKSVSYDYTNLNNESYTLKYTAYAALIDKTAVCQGYANLLYRMLLTAGVDCRIITGTGVTSSGSEAHAWNIVKLGGSWYNVDATWDSSGTKFTVNGMEHGREFTMTYRLREASGFSDHIRDDKFKTAEFEAGHPMSSSDYALPFFSGHSVSLDGKIGVNFMLNLDGMSDSEKAASYVEFTVAGREDKVLWNSDSMNYSKTAYKFTCLLSSIEMADTITAVYHYGGSRTVSQTYSLIEYMDYIEAHSNDYDSAVIDLVRALRDLGYYTQVYLSDLRGWELGIDHTAVESPAKSYTFADVYAASDVASDKTPSIGTSSPVEKVTYSLVTDSGTGLNIYVKLAEGSTGTLTATVSGAKDSSVEQLSDGRWLIGIKNIAAHDLGTEYTVSISVGGSSAGTVRISALGYVNTALGLEGRTDGFRHAVASVAFYHAAARAYINKFYGR